MKNILFDLDGTLTDPAVGITNSIIYALEKMGREILPRESLYKFIGPPLVPAFREFLGMSDEEAVLALKLYREYFSEKGLFENTPYDGISNELSNLKESGNRLFVATSKPEIFACRITEHFDLDGYFTFVAGASLDEKRSTKYEVIAYLLGSTGIDPRDSVMVGDRHHDVLGAKEFSIPTVGVLWGYGGRDELNKAGAVALVESVGELAETIAKI